MDVLMLSRLQFAATIYFHFLFVPLTLGLSVITAVMETQWARSGDEDYKRMAQFWGKLFLINFAVGVVTGITLEFQFGTNWSGYSHYVGDIFGSLLAIEATVAFFLESTFIGVWIFGWKRLSPKMHALTIWLVALGSNVSAYWILAANAWMQHPVGYTINEATGRAELTNFAEVVFQGQALVTFAHTVTAALALAGFFVLGISSYHLLKKPQNAFFMKSFKVGAIFALVFSVLVALAGHMSAEHAGKVQPAKLAAMEALWETQTYAPMNLLLWPDQDAQENSFELITVPSALSILAGYVPSHEVQGLKDFPVEDQPPVLPVFLAFRLMVGIGTLMIGLGALAVLKMKDPGKARWLLRILLFAIPLPNIAILLGWTVTEIGRLPWIVYELVRVEDAVSNLAVAQVATTLVGFVVIYGLLGAIDYFLMAKFAIKGPDEDHSNPAADSAAAK